MSAIRIISVSIFLLILIPISQVNAEPPSREAMRRWIIEMKTNSRGPFARIRWFCNDGSILPPKPYACRDHGGGLQHGEWSDRVKQLRAAGYYIANILASLDRSLITNTQGYSDLYNQILIEKFLISADDGWIFRRARYYRGAIQIENEVAMARALLLEMAGRNIWNTRGFIPLRIGADLLEHGGDTISVAKVRQLSLALSEKDAKFLPLRIKMHNQPDREDARRVRDYAASVHDPALALKYEDLAAEIDKVFAPESASRRLKDFQKKLNGNPGLDRYIATAIRKLDTTKDPAVRFATACGIMAKIREQLLHLRGAKLRLAAVDTGLAMETEQYAAGRALMERVPGASRRQRLQWLRDSTFALYGAGLISAIQLEDLRDTFAELAGKATSLDTYKSALDYFARVPGWSARWLDFNFNESMRKLAEIEPLADRFSQDVLRASPLFFYANILDGLLRDADRLTGVRRELFGRNVGAGLRSLNPGLAHGKIRLESTAGSEAFDPQGIYLLPQTTAELTPVAGILTAGAGNPLSHVQLLARNLGIPNVAVDENLIPELAAHEGQKTILAASPAGSVQLMLDRGQLNHIFAQQTGSESLIRPDLAKLDLETRSFIPLDRLRAADSGRIVGPKSANLGELCHHYPKAVAAGLAIPFGVFRSFLDRPAQNGSQTVFEWMEAGYAAIQALPPGSAVREERLESLRRRLEDYLLKIKFDDDFRRRLAKAMETVFGPDGTYGVFVRSDTNVEDLPGFTGAGLNKTIPNVVGFENVLASICKVWASPFSQRAFAWRQSHMESPQHVYASVLLLRSVPSEKSGVMVTRDIDTGRAGWLSVAVNEGVGGAVNGQAAESLRINVKTGEVRMLAQATAPWRRVLKSGGGVARELVENPQKVLQPDEIRQLINLARSLPQRYPPILDAGGSPAAADIEFGFVRGKLKLFQIRPFLENMQVRSNAYLNSLDRNMTSRPDEIVNLEEPPL